MSGDNLIKQGKLLVARVFIGPGVPPAEQLRRAAERKVEESQRKCGYGTKDYSARDDGAVLTIEQFKLCKDTLETLKVSTITQKLIAERAFFQFPHLREVNLQGSSIQSIEDWAFCECRSLKTVKLPYKELQYIGTGAFSGCSNLQGTFFIPDSVQSISRGAFEGCIQLDMISVKNLNIFEEYEDIDETQVQAMGPRPIFLPCPIQVRDNDNWGFDPTRMTYSPESTLYGW